MAIDPQKLKAWFDAHPERFKTPADYPTHDGAMVDAFGEPTKRNPQTGKHLGNPLPKDGYYPTGQLWNILRHPTGTKTIGEGDQQVTVPTTDLETEFNVNPKDVEIKNDIDVALGRN